ncbi:ankyrin repeat domain-containing protein [Corynebacterium caspium]|uniref:ankyrin repeat domain-containing protein n=1 Tax=Corynebacterium caspium TaxID=234828 RepID=UPI00036A2A90|nr:ankyrin repeat domain-containing protein [Corynebacterium caspium]WKD58861.1 Ankyrin repeats (3 copies) [Corynebacterium caspium DSM 44850]
MTEYENLPPDVQELVTKLFSFARNGDSTLLDYISHGISVDMRNEEGNTFLMIAAYAGHAELVSKLIAAGADPNGINDRGQTPLAGAVFKKEDAVVTALLEGGADPKLGTPNAIDTARLFQREDLLERFE